jgi:hypothetical protein
MDVATGITISKFVDARAGITLSAGDLTTYGNIYNNGDYYAQPTKTFYSTNIANS